MSIRSATSAFALAIVLAAPGARAQTSTSTFPELARVTHPATTARAAASAPGAAAAPAPPSASSSAGRFVGAWLAGAAGSFGGGFVGCLMGCFGEGEDLRMAFTYVGVGSALGSGILAGAVNGHIGRGILGGVLGYGAALGAMKLVDEAGGDGIEVPITGALVQGLVAATAAAIGGS